MFAVNLKNSLCRTCLSTIKNKEIFNIFDTEDLAKKIMSCAALTVNPIDEYPTIVCLECYKQITKFYEFQQMCLKSQTEFNELLRVSEEGSIRNGDPLNANNIDILNVTDIYIEKKNRGRPPKKKPEVYQKENILLPDQHDLKIMDDGPLESLKSPLACESNCEPKSDDLLQHTEDLIVNENKTTENRLRTDLNEIAEMAIRKTDSRDSTQELKSVIRCIRCDQNFNTAEHLEAHEKQHDGSPPYTCTYDGCTRSFNRWYFFNKHQKDHNVKKDHMHKCDEENCDRVYKNKCALNIHKRKCHNYGPELKRHMCEICGKVFKSATVLNDHRYTHIDRNQLPYACEEEGCSKRFSTKEKLRVHKMRHAGIKNFICPYCGMRKTTLNELKSHINYHTLERTWKCHFCPKVCNSAGNLKMHVKSIHEGAKDFACRFCERSFAKADTKKYHEMTHTGEKPHKCEQCGRRFVQPAALRAHRRTHLKHKKKFIENQSADEIRTKDQTIEFVERTVKTKAMVAEISSDNYTNLEL